MPNTRLASGMLSVSGGDPSCRPTAAAGAWASESHGPVGALARSLASLGGPSRKNGQGDPRGWVLGARMFSNRGMEKAIGGSRRMMLSTLCS